MKIVYLVQHFSEPGSPGGARPYQAARLLAQRGHDVHVVTAEASDSSGRWTRRRTSGFTVHAVGVAYANNMSWTQRVRSFLSFAARASARARALRADVVFASSTPLTVAIPGMVAAAGRAPFVFEVRDLWPEMPIAFGALRNGLLRRAAFALARLAYNRSARVVALSEGMKQGVVAHGTRDDKVVVIPNACDRLTEKESDHFAGFLERGLDQRDLVVFIGSMGPLYDLGWVLRLAAAVHEKKPSVAFCLVGDGRERPALLEAARQQGHLNKSVFFFDPIPRREVLGAMAQASVVLSVAADVPGIGANSANKFFDGLAARRPVAVNYGGWQGELLTSTGAGISLSRDVAHAAEQLDLALGDREGLDRMGVAAGELAHTQFDRELLVGRLETVLQEARARDMVAR